MFTLTVYLENFSLDGFEALDWRRAHKFSDGLSVYARSGGGSCQSFVVNEDFARRWFDPRWASGCVYVSLEELRDGEFQLDNGNCIKPYLSRDRAIELFLRQESSKLAADSHIQETLLKSRWFGWFWRWYLGERSES